MAKLAFSNYNAVDVIADNSFNLLVSAIPGAGGVEKKLSIQCKGFTMPGLEVSRLEVIIQGFKFYNSAGNTVFPGQFTVTFQEDSSYSIGSAFRAWKEVVAGTESGTTGGNKNDYARDIILQQLDPRGNVAGEVTLQGCYPMTLPEIVMQSTQTPTATEYQVTFSFDIAKLGSVDNR